MLTASSDKTARLWDPENGRCKQILEGHTDEIFSCAFNYEGNTIITGEQSFFILGFSLNVDLFKYLLSVFIMKLIVSIHELSFPGLLPGYLIYLFQVVKTTPVGSGDEAGVRCVCDVQYYGASVQCFIQVCPPPTARGKEALNILTVCSSHPTPRV